MSNVVNLNRFRKRKAKAEQRKKAEVNRRLHGRTKAERAREELQKQRLTHAVEGAKLLAPEQSQQDAGEPAQQPSEETEPRVPVGEADDT